ncbi:MAG: hypothetical protein ACKPKO_59855, partial [Candidatus Fonsibacter sp.]
TICSDNWRAKACSYGGGSLTRMEYKVLVDETKTHLFTYAVKAIQELSQIVKDQQVQINTLQQQLQNHLLTNTATIMT